MAGRLIGVERALLGGNGRARPDARGQARRASGVPAERDRLPVAGRCVSGEPTLVGSRRSGRSTQLEQVADRHDVTRVVFSARDIEESELERMLRDCRALSLKVSVLPRLADVLGPAVEIDDVEGVTVLGVNPPWLPRSSRMVKRGMDLLIATAC